MIETLSLAGRDHLAPALTAPEPADPEARVEIGRPVWQALPIRAPEPADDPVTAEKVDLGRRLFHDTALSRDRTLSCVSCHDPALGGASGFRRFPSLATPYTERYRLTDDLGLAKQGSAGIWRIPSLRNVALTGPYFHNGSVGDLKEAVRIMATVQAGRVMSEDGKVATRVEWSPETLRLARRTPSPLSEAEVADIVAFLEALSGDALAARRRN